MHYHSVNQVLELLSIVRRALDEVERFSRKRAGPERVEEVERRCKELAQGIEEFKEFIRRSRTV